MEIQKVTLINALKGGAIAGLIGAGVNNLWSLVANSLGATIPLGFALAVTMSSLFPVLIGSVIFYGLVKFLSKGKTIWYAVAAAVTLLSLFPVFNSPKLPDGTVMDATFPLLAAPMHFLSGFLATWGIPRWSK